MAGRYIDGGGDFRRGYSSGRDGFRGHARNRGKLALVELPVQRHDDGVLLCPHVAAVGNHHRRAAG